MKIIRDLAAVSGLLLSASVHAVSPSAADKLAISVAQLRLAAGDWAVTTEFLNEDGSVARTVPGSYHFEWVIPDRVLIGKSGGAEPQAAGGMLFYVSEKRGVIEMVSVHAEGRPWVMTGALGEETRYTQPFDTQDGKTGQLRFTRSNVAKDRFESRMEYTEDGGKTWKPGNRQQFRRPQAKTG